MRSIVQGIILGSIIVLPGMSGGTVFVIFGIYENILKDLVRLNIKPYIPLILGAIVGIFISGTLFALFFEEFRDETAIFLMGCLLASTRAVLKGNKKTNLKSILFLLLGATIGFYMSGEPIGLTMVDEDVSLALLIVGGAISSAAMIIPGIPGSSALIVLGIYDSILYYIKELELFNLAMFGMGSALGIALLAKLLNKMYEKYRNIISYFFAGLILGSARALIPYYFKSSLIVIFIIGFSLVWIWSGKEEQQSVGLREH
ncbi:MAG: DUF368 domain-containing protein [Clostridiaceae bacterium]|nr:DUF368 domain-containing protein [Clostridiaceae bacterium]